MEVSSSNQRWWVLVDQKKVVRKVSLVDHRGCRDQRLGHFRHSWPTLASLDCISLENIVLYGISRWISSGTLTVERILDGRIIWKTIQCCPKCIDVMVSEMFDDVLLNEIVDQSKISVVQREKYQFDLRDTFFICAINIHQVLNWFGETKTRFVLNHIA